MRLICQKVSRFPCEQDWEGLAQLWPLLCLFPFLGHCLQSLLGKRCSVEGFERGRILLLRFVSQSCVWQSLSCFCKPLFLLLCGTCNTARRWVHCEVQCFNKEYKHNRNRWWRKVEPLLSLFLGLLSIKSSLCQTRGKSTSFSCRRLLLEAQKSSWVPKLVHKSRNGLLYFPSKALTLV